MTKKEIVWLIIRLIGVYFIFQALLAAWDLLAILFTFLSDVAKIIYASVTFNMLKTLAWAIGMVAFYGFLGWYFIRDGSRLFEILNREEKAEKPIIIEKETPAESLD